MNFTIEIKAPELADAINKLAVALGSSQLHMGQAMKDVGEETPKIETKKDKTPVKEEPKKEAAETKEPEKKEAPKESPELSLEVVRGKLAEYASQSKDRQVEVMDALSRFGVKKLTDVKPEDYKELLSLLGLSA